MAAEFHPFEQLLRERIVVLDGAMGTTLQRLHLGEADYRGQRFRDWKGKDLKGAHELLLLTRPDAVERVHEEYLQAGADVVETNTFSATTIGLHEFLFDETPASGRKDPEFFERVVHDPELRAIAREMNVAAARLARQAIERVGSGTPRFVAGALGPLPVTASLSPDVNDPGFRAVTFDQIKRSYRDQVDGLLEGGVDLLLVETVFDTLNAKAALFAIADAFERRGARLPVIISGTITDASGRTLSGQTTEAFYNSIRHARALAVGLNCALGAKELRPYVEELAKLAEVFTSCHPNAGLPNAFGEYEDTPDSMSRRIGEWARAGLINIAGGCCGTTPEHIAAMGEALADLAPREPAKRAPALRLAGLEPFNVDERSPFGN